MSNGGSLTATIAVNELLIIFIFIYLSFYLIFIFLPVLIKLMSNGEALTARNAVNELLISGKSSLSSQLLFQSINHLLNPSRYMA